MITFAKSIFKICLFAWCWQNYTLATLAQIVPDNSLDIESSVVRANNIKGAIADYIEGGAVRGGNLFHSFSKFDLAVTDRAYFAEPTGIDNILTRVTGTDASNIRGTLGVDGSANLFLLNPNGIIFGQQAQLDISGSFLATTAESYIFGQGLDFSATNPEIPPLLAVNIPSGLQFGGAPGTIVNNSRSPSNLNTLANELKELSIAEGLRVGKEKTLSLLGGEIISAGGYLNTVEGRIELGAVGANSKVVLNSSERGWIANYDGVERFADLKIAEHGGIDGGNTGNTQIALTGRNISLGYDWDTLAKLDLEQSDFLTLNPLPVLDEAPSDRIQIAAHNQNNTVPVTIDINASNTLSIIDPSNNQQNILAHTSGTGDAGTINLAAEHIITYGASVESWTLAGATGDSGTINFMANNLAIQYGGGGVNTFGEGAGGTIFVDIAEDVAIAKGGFGAEARDKGAGGTVKIAAENLKIVSAGIGTGTFASGQGGTIELKIANNLVIDSGGFGADAKGSGDGGSIEIEAKNISFSHAGLGANTWGSGAGGEITIHAETMIFKDGVIGAESGQNIDRRDFVVEAPEELGLRNAGDGGSIQIFAQDLLIDNANVTTSTFGQGNGGNLSLEVNSITAIGGDLVTGINSFTDGKGAGGNINITGDRLTLSQGATIAANSSNRGRAGDVTINMDDLLQLDSAGSILVDGGAVGLPGNINIKGKDLLLREGKISATTNKGIQGNIRLTGEQLLLRNRSQIVTNAGKDATGGNIFIDLKDNLLGVDNSEIAASAEQGQGGNIQINTGGIFLSKNSGINANSKSGADGTTQVSTLASDRLDSDLVQLPAKPADPNQYLARGCGSSSNNKFISVGRGGLPENPLMSIANNSVLADLDASMDEENYQKINSPLPSIEPIVEAQIWSINANGNIELIALSNSILWQEQLNCLE